MKKNIIFIAALLILAAAGTIYHFKKHSQVLAKVGSVSITAEDFSKELSNSPEVYLNYLSTMEGKKQLLEILLKEKVLMNSARKSGIYRKKEVQESIKTYLARAKDQEEQFRKGLILREYLRQLQDGQLKVSDADLKSYYDQNKADFEHPVKVSASHILSTTSKDAEIAHSRVTQGKEDFAQVAKELSKDPSAARGGFIGEVFRGDLADLPEFEEELFRLKSGEISKVVKTKIGYHIIKKAGEIKMPGQSYEQAAPQIRRILEKKKFDTWIEKEKDSQGVKINEKVLASVVVPSGGGSSQEVPPTVK